MPAMHRDVLEQMQTILHEKMELMIRLEPFEMTHQECLRIVAPDAHIALLNSAAHVADVSSNEHWFPVKVPAVADGESDFSVHLLMRTHAQRPPPLRPRMPYWQIPVDDEHAAIGERVIKWCDKRMELGRRFAMARFILNALNYKCDNGAQLRYMFPGVAHLCKLGVSPRMDTWMQKFGAFKPVSSTPAISLGFRRALQDATALLTSGMLIGEDIPAREVGEVDIDMWHGDMPEFMFEETADIGHEIQRLA